MRLFVDAVTSGTEVPAGLKDGLMSNRIGLACKKSLAENHPVSLIKQSEKTKAEP